MKLVSVVFLLLAPMLAFCNFIAAPPKDCSEVTSTAGLASVGLASQVITNEESIFPTDPLSPVQVSCVQLPGEVEKYTVILKRTNGLESFTRTITEYRNGFGVAPAEYFIGLENLRILTSSKNYELLIRLESEGPNPSIKTAQYNVFSIGDEVNNYPLTVSGFTGDAGNILADSNGKMFITCPRETKIGFWYGSCEFQNINSLKIEDGQKNLFNVGVKNPDPPLGFDLKVFTMMIRPI